MTKIVIDRAVVEGALSDVCAARLCEVNSMSSRQEMLRLMIRATDALRAALAQQEIDWSLLEATQSSLREHMAEIRRLRAALAQALDALTTPIHEQPFGLKQSAVTAIRAALEQEEREDGPATCWKCGAEDGGTSCGAGCGLIEAEQQEPTREPSVDQLDQIIDGLARCHVRESSREFLRTWIRDWTTHKLSQQEEQDPWTLDDVYETIIHWDEGGGKRSRRELARRIVALYTHPPRREWQGLNFDQLQSVMSRHFGGCELTDDEADSAEEFARAIEAALKEKNT